MKKSLFMLGLAVAAMTSCSNDELMEVNTNNVITFESHVNKGTRAVTDTENSKFTKFYVFGYHGSVQDFTNDPVELISDEWTCKEVEWASGNYFFGAYATKNTSRKLDETDGKEVKFENGELTFNDFVVSDAEDLVAAIKNVPNTGMTNTNSAVSLDFKHMLSKIQFVFNNKAKEDLTMDIEDITINVNNTGDCTYDGTDITWDDVKNATPLTFAGKTSIAKNTTFTSTDHLVIPGQAIANIKASFTVTFKNSSDVTVTTVKYTNVALTGSGAGAITEWEAGKFYKYTADLSPAMPYITFSPTVVPWEDATVPYPAI